MSVRGAVRAGACGMLAALLLGACTPSSAPRPWAEVHERTPAFLLGREALDPSLAADARGRVALTWVTRDSAGADVWFAISRDSGESFGAPQRVNLALGSVSSYPESRPLVVLGADQRVTVLWTAQRDSVPNADDIVARASTDDGVSFGPVAVLNSDAHDPHSTYHGFLAASAAGVANVAVAWIDGRSAQLAPGEDEPARSEVWMTSSQDGGYNWGPDHRVAGDVCSCCRLHVELLPDGRTALAYRGATDDLRDPRLLLAHVRGEMVVLDSLVSRDHWRLSGCPSIGPSVSFESSEGGHYLWYTGSDSVADGAPPGVYLCAWRWNGTLGPKRALRDSLREAGHPLLATMGDGALAAVLGRAEADTTRHLLAVRRVANDGALSPWLFLGNAVRSAALAAPDARRAWVAWIEKLSDGPRLRLVRLDRTR